MKHYSALTARYAMTILLMGGLCLSFGRGVFAANGINQVIMFQGKVTNSNGTNVADGAYDFEFKLYDAAGAGSTLFTETWSSAALWSSTMSSAPGNGGTQLTYSTGTNESTIKVGQILWNTTKQESVIVTAVDTAANTVDISPTRQAWAGSDTVTNRIYVKDGVFRVALNSLNTSLSGVNFGTNNIFLGVNFNADGEMKPRIQYSAVPYAFNAEKVNGLTVTNTSNNPFGSTTTLKIEDGKTVSFSGSISLSGTDSTAFTLPSGSDTLVGLTATQSLTNKTIGSTGLVFNGATTDITSFTNEDLTFTPNGTGSLILSSDFNSGVLIGTSTNTLAPLSVRGGIGSNAGFIVDQLLSGDLFTASAAGAAKFTIANDGSASMSGTLTLPTDGVIRSGAGDLNLAYKSGANAWTTGMTLLDNSGNVGIGTTAPTSRLHVSSSSIGNALMTINELGATQDIFTASAAGVSRFTIANSGIITASAYTTANGLLTTDGLGIVSQTAAGISNQCLKGDLSWGACGAGEKVHAVYTATSGTDVQVQFTGDPDSAPSAGGGFLTLPSNTSRILVVTRAGGGGGGGIGAANALKGAGGGGEGGYSEELISSLASTYYYTVGTGGTAGSNAGGTGGTGNSSCFGTNSTACTGPMLSATGGVGGVGSNAAGARAGGAGGTGSGGDINLTGDSGDNSGTATNAIFSGGGGGAGGGVGLTASGVGNNGANGGGGGGGLTQPAGVTTRTGGTGGDGYVTIYVYTNNQDTTNYWQQNSGAISPAEITNDVLFGGLATASAKFAFLNNAGGTPTASISGNLGNTATYLTGTGILATTVNQTLTLGAAGTGNITLSPNGSTALTALGSGNIGIGTTAPVATLFVAGQKDGARSALMIDQLATGTGSDLFTASAAGTPRFSITNAGGIKLGINEGVSNQCLLSGGTGSAASWGACGGGSSTWDLLAGALRPAQASVVDLLLGGTSTSSAKFAFINNLTGTPTASIAGSTADNAVYLTGNGTLATTNSQTLRLGGGSTGDIELDSGVNGTIHIGTANATGLEFGKVGQSAFFNGSIGVSQTVSAKDGSASQVQIGEVGPGNTAGAVFGQSNSANLYLGAADSLYTDDSFIVLGKAGIGTTAPASTLFVAGQKDGARSALIIDQLATGTGSDLFTASAAGTPIFTITNAGGIQLGSSVGTGSQCLLGGATASWGACGGGTNYWDFNNGVLTSKQATVADLLLGGTSTSSAKFAFINNLTGTPTASIAGTVANTALYIDGAGNIGTTAMQSLTLGSASTGNLILPGYTGQNGVLFGTQTTGVLAQATTASTGLCLLSGASSPTWGSCSGSVAATGWDVFSGALRPNQASVVDLLLGGTSTASAKFAFINNLTGTPTASIAGNLALAVPTGVDPAAGLTIYNGGNLNFQSSVGGDAGLTSRMFIQGNTGNVGIGLTNPASRFDVSFPTLTTASANGVNISGTLANGASGVQNGLNVNVTAAPTATFVTSTGIKVNMTDATGIAGTDQGLNVAITSTPGAFAKTITGADITLTDDGTVNGTVQGLNISANRSGQHAGSSGNIKGLTLSATSTGTSTSGLDTVAGLEVNAGASNGNGSAQTIYGLRVKQAANTVTSGTITYYGVHIANQTMDTTGTSAQTGLFIGNITGADTNYAAIFAGGKIGMGTTTPESLLHLTGASVGKALFTLDELGMDQDIITASAGGLTRFTVANTGAVDINSSAGGLTINSTGSVDIHKTTSNDNQTDTDFERTANSTSAVLSNVTAANGDLSLDSGTVSGDGTITTGSQPAAPGALGAGAHSISRPDGKYLVIRGGATTLYIYDTLANTFSTSSQVLNNAAGAGALAIPRADGKYLVIHGGGAATNSIVDPMGVSGVGASVGSNNMGAGTNAFRRQNGRYLILNGGAGTTQIPDVTVSTGATIWTSGPAAASGTWGAGSLVLPRPDGSALIVNGGATATTNLYTPWSGAASIGVFAAGPVLPTNCEINGAGSVAIQKADGRYIILSKAGVSVEYDPVTNTMGACQAVGPANALADGAHAIRLQDRRFLILRGSGTTDAYIYNPETNTYSTHATPTSTQGAGLHSIQKSDGTWQILVGGATTTNNFNTQLVMSGSYTSEDFTTTSLNINSSLLWTIGAESLFVGTSSATTNTPQSGVEFMVRTASTQGGLSSATDIPIKRSGDLIQATGTDAWARVTINFTRPIPSPIYDDTRRVWLGNGMTNMIRDYQSPTVFDYTIDNSTVLRRNIFDFSNSQLNTDPTEASPSAFTRVRGQANGLVLPPGEVPGNGVTTTTGLIGASGFNSGKPGPHPTMLQATGDGTIVMARPGGLFAVIASGSANLSLYDSASSQFIAQSGAGNIPTASAGAGAFALKLPNGKFLIIFGNFTGAGQTTTNIYDPNAGSGSRFIAGPTLSAAAGAGAQAIQNTDGTYTIIHGGGATTSSLFNPFTDLTKGTATLPAGPTLTTAANCGAWAIPLQGQYQGKYRVAVGAAANAQASTVSMMYDAVTKTFTAGQALTNGAGCGGMVFQRQDGYWISITGGSNVAAGSTTTNIINPFAGSNAASTSTLAGPTVTALHRGVFVIPRPDGTFLIGGQSAWNTNSTALQVYFPWGSTMGIGAPIGYTIALTAVLNNAAGSGAVTFQRPDGKWVIINGGATVGSNLVNIYDAGWFADGQYLSGQMKVPQLTSTSALTWKKTVDDSISMEVRTAPSRVALLSEDYRDINPSDANMRITPGDQWLQMQINFSRKFPTYDGVNTDVWTSGGAKNYLTIPVPTLLEYKITNDSDLLNLKSGGQAIFRVNGSGNIYAGQQGGFFTSGADLAENYTSSESLMPGEVVSIDSTDNKSVKRTKSQYQKDVLGVVSTDPGFVAGAYTENSYPIALVGRVPVKVSTENGDIKAGDVLASSSIPGYAMKAQVAGRVIGRVLEDLRVENEHACPHEGFGVAPENRCGTVMLFVNLVDYQGGSVEMVMDEKGARKDVGAEELGLQIASVSSDETGLESTSVFMATPERVTQRQLNTLAFLKELRAKGSGSLSEIFTDRITAVHEIVTPQIIADTIIARKIKAQSIEGMEFVYGLKDQDSRITSLESLFASSSAHLSTKSASTSGVISSEVKQEIAFNEVSKTSLTLRDDPLLTLNSLSVEGLATVSADLRVKNNSLIEGILSVIDTITTKRLVVFDLATFFGDVLFKKDVTFEGKVTFEKDAAGYAVIKKGTQKVDVTFDAPYGHSPIVTASLDLDIYKDEKGKDEDQEASSERILNENYTYVIAKKSEKGFTIILNKKATDDIRFSWSAVQIPNEEKKNEHDIMSSLFFDTNSTPTTFSPE